MRIFAALAFLVTALVPGGIVGQGQRQAPPPAPPCRPESTQYVCGQTAPEDLVLVPGGKWVYASVFGVSGGIRLINVSDRTTTVAYPSATVKEQLDKKTYDMCPGPPTDADKANFRTHGLGLRPGKGSRHTLYAVHHGARESVEVFQLDARPKTPVLTWIGCVVAMDPIGLNSMVPLSDGGFAATNYLIRTGDVAAARAKMSAGQNNGEVWEWHSGKGWKIIPGSESSGPNGLEISRDGKWLYVAAWGSRDFFRLSLGQNPPKKDVIPLGFRVDNIRWAPDGSIFAVGQGAQTSNVVKINPSSLQVQKVLDQPDTPEFGASTVAIQIGKEIWIGSFRGDRILRIPAK